VCSASAGLGGRAEGVVLMCAWVRVTFFFLFSLVWGGSSGGGDTTTVMDLRQLGEVCVWRRNRKGDGGQRQWGRVCGVCLKKKKLEVERLVRNGQMGLSGLAGLSAVGKWDRMGWDGMEREGRRIEGGGRKAVTYQWAG
jgi:hypothetical protein